MKIQELTERMGVQFIPPPTGPSTETEVPGDKIAWNKLWLARWCWTNQSIEKAVDGIVLLGIMGDPRRLPVPVTLSGVELPAKKSYNKMAGVVFSTEKDDEGWYKSMPSSTQEYDEARIYINADDYSQDLMNVAEEISDSNINELEKFVTIAHEYRHRGFNIAAKLGILPKFSKEVEHALIYSQQYQADKIGKTIEFTRIKDEDGKEYTNKTSPTATEIWIKRWFLGKGPQYFHKRYQAVDAKVYKWIRSHPVPDDLPKSLQDVIKRVYGVRIGTIQDIDNYNPNSNKGTMTA